MVVAEALSVGTPVLISDKVALAPDVLADGCGLVAPDTLAGVYTLLAHFTTLTDPERSALRANALACYQKRFQPCAVAARLEPLLSEVARHNP